MMQRKRSWGPFGLSPLEVTIEIMSSWLNLSTFQQNVASESYPAFMFYLGDSVSSSQAEEFKAYWDKELMGRGRPGIFGGTGKMPKSIPLKAQSEDALYLKYQETLVRILAFSFDLKPQDFGMERDVNRNTSEVAHEQSILEAIAPPAELFQGRINQRVIPRIAEEVGDEMIKGLQFEWLELTPKDQKAQADIDAIYLDRDVLLIDEVRSTLNLGPRKDGRGVLSPTQFKQLALILPDGESTVGELDPSSVQDPNMLDGGQQQNLPAGNPPKQKQLPAGE
jgi:hypothetical protein